MKKSLILLSLIAIFLLGYFIFRFQIMNDEFLTVTDVWKNPQQYAQQVVRLRGTVNYALFMNQLECCPKACNCYDVSYKLNLVSDPPTHNNPFSPVDHISIIDLNCSGNECSLNCSPFQPGAAKVYEFVGRVVITEQRDNIPISIGLTDIDYSLSRQLEDNVWKPIKTERSIMTLAPELAPTLSMQSVKACEEQ